jgi:hypothetical protein
MHTYIRAWAHSADPTSHTSTFFVSPQIKKYTHTYTHTHARMHTFCRFDGPLIARTSIFLVSSLVKNTTTDASSNHSQQIIKGRTAVVAAPTPTTNNRPKKNGRDQQVVKRHTVRVVELPNIQPKSLEKRNAAELYDKHVDDVFHTSDGQDSSGHAQARDTAPSNLHASQASLLGSNDNHVDQPSKCHKSAQSVQQGRKRAKKQDVHDQSLAGKLEECAADDQLRESSATGNVVCENHVQQFDLYKYRGRRKV